MKENKRYAEIKETRFIVDEVKSPAIHITMRSDSIYFRSNKNNLKVNTVNIQNHKDTLIKRKLITQIINRMKFKSIFSK